MDILADLLSQQVPELIANLVFVVKLHRELVRIIALTNEYVLAASLSNLDCQCQDLF